MGVEYVIEHMEQDDEQTKRLPPWVNLEYSHMLTFASSSSTVHFTHLSPSALKPLEQALASSSSASRASFALHAESLEALVASENIPKSQVCLLDPKAPAALSPADGEAGKFKYFVFGGILGDDPPRDRTSELRALGFAGRHLGEVQMTTDTALGVTKLVVEDGIPLDQIRYVNQPTISFNAHESVEMPFRYIADENGEPTLPPGMRQLLKDDLDKSFDF